MNGQVSDSTAGDAFGGDASPCPTCGTKAELLLEYLDETLSPSRRPEVATRVLSCAACRAFVEEHRAVGRALARYYATADEGPTLPPGELAARVRQRARASVRRRVLAAASLVAAAVALVSVPLILVERSPAPEELTAELSTPDTPSSEEADVISDLDILEAFGAAGLEPSAELVAVLLGERTALNDAAEAGEDEGEDLDSWEGADFDVLDLLLDHDLSTRNL